MLKPTLKITIYSTYSTLSKDSSDRFYELQKKTSQDPFFHGGAAGR